MKRKKEKNKYEIEGVICDSIIFSDKICNLKKLESLEVCKIHTSTIDKQIQELCPDYKK